MILEKFTETIAGSPPDGWTIGHVTIKTRYDVEFAVEAFRRGPFAVHIIDISRAYRLWRLTHAPSGLMIWTFDTLDQAAELAERIEPLADWGAFVKQIPAGTDLYPKVRDAIAEVERS